MSTPGEIVRQRREALGLSQTELARKAHVHLNTLRDIESKGGARSSFLPPLAEALRLDAVALCKGRRVVVDEADSSAARDPAGGHDSKAGTQINLADTLQTIRALIDGLSPLLQQVARDELTNYTSGNRTLNEALATLEALQRASSGIPPTTAALMETQRLVDLSAKKKKRVS